MKFWDRLNRRKGKQGFNALMWSTRGDLEGFPSRKYWDEQEELVRTSS
jgi:hypothetical protein